MGTGGGRRAKGDGEERRTGWQEGERSGISEAWAQEDPRALEAHAPGLCVQAVFLGGERERQGLEPGSLEEGDGEGLEPGV